MSNPETYKRWYTQHRANGLCAYCKRPAEPSRSLCSIHRKARKEYDRRETERRRQAGLCIAKGCPNEVARPNNTYCVEHIAKARVREKARLQRIKLEVLAHYGDRRCACCGETRIEFLTIDHIHGGGRQHRFEQRIGGMCHWLKKQHFPDGYQILCMNCNFAKGLFGRCPHEVERDADRSPDSTTSISSIDAANNQHSPTAIEHEQHGVTDVARSECRSNQDHMIA